MHYVLLFLEGIITFISPCLLPLLPVYLSYFAAGQAGKYKALANSVGFVLGFTVVFVLLGALTASLGQILFAYLDILNVVAGIAIIILGLNY